MMTWLISFLPQRALLWCLAYGLHALRGLVIELLHRVQLRRDITPDDLAELEGAVWTLDAAEDHIRVFAGLREPDPWGPPQADQP